MITRLIIKSKNGQYDIQKPILNIHNGVKSTIQNQSITLSVIDPFQISQSPYITSINKVGPDSLNNIQILGDMCTSVMDSTDPDFSQFNTSDIAIFDGCPSCSSCQAIARMQDTLKNYQIWLSGLKDCQLYYQNGASSLWDNMIDKKKEQLKHLEGCIVDSTLQRSFGKATRLLYQYKALVYMWNYLVFLKAGNTQIIQAAESYSGFIVRSKRSVDTCESQNKPQIRMHIQIQFVQGQTPQNLNQQLKMYIYTQIVEQNTQIQVNSPTGSITTQPGVFGSIQTDIKTSGTSVKGQIIFKPMQSCKGIFSGGIKILPVIALKKDQIELTQNGSISLASYVKLKNKANHITESQQLKVNRWQASVWWQYDNFGSQGKIDQTNSQQTKIYTTGYYAYPKGGKNAGGFLR